MIIGINREQSETTFLSAGWTDLIKQALKIVPSSTDMAKLSTTLTATQARDLPSSKPKDKGSRYNYVGVRRVSNLRRIALFIAVQLAGFSISASMRIGPTSVSKTHSIGRIREEFHTIDTKAM